MANPKGGWAVRVYADVYWVGAGVGNTAYGPAANVPGFGAGQYAAVVPEAQKLLFQQGEQVIAAGATPTAAEIGTALTSAATDLQAQLTAAYVTKIGNWASGGQ